MYLLHLLGFCAIVILEISGTPTSIRRNPLECAGRPARTPRGETCEIEATWPIQSADLSQDVYDVEKFFGLPIPVKATLLMLSHLDPMYMVPPELNVPVSGCQLNDKTRTPTQIDIFNANNICGIQVRLTGDEDMRYLVPDEHKRFGLVPLLLKQVYNKLRTGVRYINKAEAPPAALGWTWGHSNTTDTQQFFSAVTSLTLNSKAIKEFKVGGPVTLRSILEDYQTSPVFFATKLELFLITAHAGDGEHRSWTLSGVTSTGAQQPISFTEEQFQLFQESTVLYHVEHGILSTRRADCPRADVVG